MCNHIKLKWFVKPTILKRFKSQTAHPNSIKTVYFETVFKSVFELGSVPLSDSPDHSLQTALSKSEEGCIVVPVPPKTVLPSRVEFPK